MEQRSASGATVNTVVASEHRAPMSLDELGDGPTISAAVDLFFGDLRLAPRTKKTYWHGIAKFLRHLAQHEGIDPERAPVAALRPDHVTSFAA
ncbi:MAG: integrase family protein, partial [Thermomicrobiales bacterium]|nr:integrase family protein [Thermomicrobiales bacterium]